MDWSPEVMILGDIRLVLPILLDQYYCYLMMLGEPVESLYVFLSIGQESARLLHQMILSWALSPWSVTILNVGAQPFASNSSPNGLLLSTTGSPG